MDGGQKDLTPKPRIVQFKDEQGRIQRVNLGKLEAVFANIETHNQEFSLGAMLAKGISSHIRDEGNGGSEGSKPFSAEKDKGDALSETLGIIHADSFSPIGISFDTASETGVKLIAQDEQIAETKIKFGLQNPDAFVSFLDTLSALDKQELSKSAMPSLISTIGTDISSQIWGHYAGNLKDERVHTIERRLSDLVLGYKKLGLEVPGDLENFAKYSSKGILGEYVSARGNRLLEAETTSYGSLANWRNDILAKQVQERWDQALAAVEQIKSNPKAKELLEAIKKNLSHQIEEALGDMDSKGDEGWKDKKEKREIFENAKINLQLV